MVCIPENYKKWLTLVGGFLIYFANGAFYTFSNMTPYVISYLRSNTGSSIRYSDAKWITLVQTVSAVFASLVSGIMSYKLKVPVKVCVMIGAILYRY